MAFVLLIIIGAYILFKCNREDVRKNAYQKEYDAKYEAHREYQKQWFDKVIDQELEDDMIKGIRERRPELMQEIKDTIQKYPEAANGNSFGEIIQYNEFQYRGKYIATHSATRILMANRGKLMKKDAHEGIFIGYCGDADFEKREFNKNAKAFVSWIDKMLKAKGVCEPLYLGHAQLTSPVCWNTAIKQPGSIGHAAWRPAFALYNLNKIYGEEETD